VNESFVRGYKNDLTGKTINSIRVNEKETVNQTQQPKWPKNRQKLPNYEALQGRQRPQQTPFFKPIKENNHNYQLKAGVPLNRSSRTVNDNSSPVNDETTTDVVVIVIGIATLWNAIAAMLLTLMLIWYHRIIELKKTVGKLTFNSSNNLTE